MLAIPEIPAAVPAGLSQLNALAGEKTWQRLADGADKILVTDDAHLTLVQSRQIVLEAGTVRLVALATHQAVNRPQVKGFELLLLLLDQLDQHRMGRRLVFLNRA